MSKNRRTARPAVTKKKAPPPSPIPGWVWVFGIAAFLCFAGFLYYLASIPATPEKPAPAPVAKQEPRKVTEPAKPAVTSSASSPKKEETPKKQETSQEEARFKFYEMLPKSEVVAPHVDEYKSPGKKEEFHYILQTGSFRSAEDAERQRAMVAFQGLKGSVDRITASDGSYWYRVHVGPFESRSRMNRAVDKLVAINIQPLVKKVKPENAKQGR